MRDEQASYTVCVFLSLLACKSRDGKEDATRLIAAWYGKQIIFPQNPVFTRYVTDTVDFQAEESEFKVLVYMNPTGCTSCQLQLTKWKEFMASIDSASGGRTPFLFYLHPHNLRDVQVAMTQYRFDLPVVIDREDALNSLNHFPENINYQTFLLDKENKVVVLGNPIHHPKIKELYLNQVSHTEQATVAGEQTTVEALPLAVDLGSFPQANPQSAEFTIRNTGRYPFGMDDVSPPVAVLQLNIPNRTYHPEASLF